MTLGRRGVLCITLWASAAGGPMRAEAQVAPPLDLDVARRTTVVSPGLIHEHHVSTGTDGAAPLNVHVLQVDLTRYHLDVALALGQVLGQETTSAVAARRGALAAVNGGFSVSNDPWNPIHGDPNGFVVLDGEVVSEPVPGRDALGICTADPAQRIVTVRPELSVVVEGGGLVQPAGLNRAADSADVVVYTPRWGRSTITPKGTLEAVVRGGRVVSRSREGSTDIPDDGFVVAARGSPAETLAAAMTPGTPLGVSLAARDARSGRPLALEGCSFTSAGPVVARSGATLDGLAGPAHREGFVHDRHPRTAVGLDDGGATAWLVVVDGRQDHSAGMTLAELAAFVLDLGASLVYNLDGGGSSTMVVGGTVVNVPSDGRERRRTDVLLVRPR